MSDDDAYAAIERAHDAVEKTEAVLPIVEQTVADLRRRLAEFTSAVEQVTLSIEKRRGNR